MFSAPSQSLMLIIAEASSASRSSPCPLIPALPQPLWGDILVLSGAEVSAALDMLPALPPFVFAASGIYAALRLAPCSPAFRLRSERDLRCASTCSLLLAPCSLPPYALCPLLLLTRQDKV